MTEIYDGVSLAKSKIGSKNGFWIFVLNRFIQDHSRYGASKEPNSPDLAQCGFLSNFQKH